MDSLNLSFGLVALLVAGLFSLLTFVILVVIAERGGRTNQLLEHLISFRTAAQDATTSRQDGSDAVAAGVSIRP